MRSDAERLPQDPKRLVAIRERVEAATDGPWRVTTDGDDPPGDYGDSDAEHGWIEPHGAYTADRATNEFIAHAREDVPWLLAEVERLTRALDDLHGEASRWVYLDATPGQSYDDWEEMAKGRAGWVVFETGRALAVSVPVGEGEPG
jgi:hypothetical protein